jgi:hypothetical protein
MVTNTNADAAAVAPRAKDMMAPPIVMNVIPAAMQPITEAVLIKAVKLGIDRKLGVKIAQTNNPPIRIARAAVALVPSSSFLLSYHLAGPRVVRQKA